MERDALPRNGERKPVATGGSLLLTDAIFRGQFNDVLDDLRTRDPVHYDQEFDRVVLTRAVDVEGAISDLALLSNAESARPGTYLYRPPGSSVLNQSSFMFTDDPDHRRIRNLVSKAFNARAVDEVRPQVKAIATELLDVIEPRRPFDLIRDYTGPLPTMAIAKILGVDKADQANFRLWSESLMLNPDRTDAEKAQMREGASALQQHLSDIIAARREHPRDDLISRLVEASDEQNQLTEQEIVAACRLLMVAGNVTTTDLLGNAVVALLDHPAELAKWRANPELTFAMVEEVLRYDTPVMAVSRTAPADWRIAGCPVEAGQSVTAMLAAANRDPSLHSEPRLFQIERNHQRHISFGRGAHFCIGASLARMEAEVGLSMLFDRFPALQLVKSESLVRRATSSFNGFKHVWVESLAISG